MKPTRKPIKWLAAAVLALAAVYAAGAALLAPGLKALIEGTLRERLGMEVSIGSLTGSLAGGLVISDVRTVKPAAAGAVAALGLRRLEARYSLTSLLEGLAGFITAATLSAEGLSLEIDLDRTGPPAAGPAAGFPGSPPALRLPALRIEDAEVRLRGGGLAIDLRGAALGAGPLRPEGGRLELRAAELAWKIPGLRPGAAALAAGLTLAPGTIRLEPLLLDGRTVVEGGELRWSSPPSAVAFEAALRLLDGRADIDGRLTPSHLNARLKASGVDLAGLEALFDLGGMKLSGRLSLETSVRLPRETGGAESASGEITLATGRAGLQGLEIENAELEASLGEGRVRVHRLALESGASSLRLMDLSAPAAPILAGDFGALRQGLSGGFALVSQDLPSLIALAGMGPADSTAPIPPHRLSLAGRVDEGRLTVPEATLTAGDNRVRLRQLETALPPLAADTPLKTDIALDLRDLAALSAVFSGPDLGGTLAGEARVSGTIGDPRGEVRVAGKGIRVHGWPLGDAALRARAANETIRIESLTLSRGRDALEAKGTLRPALRRVENAEVGFAVADLGPYAALLSHPGGPGAGGRMPIQARVSGRLSLSGPWGDPDGALDLDARAIRVRGKSFGDASARLSKKGVRVAVDRFELVNGADRLGLKGSYDTARRSFGPTRAELKAADLLAYVQAAAGGATPDDGGPAGRLEVRGVAAAMEASGSLQDPRLFLEAQVERLEAAGRTPAFSAGMRLDYADRRVRIRELEIGATEGYALSIAGTLPLDITDGLRPAPGELHLEARARIRDLKPLMTRAEVRLLASGTLDAQLDLHGTWAKPVGRFALDATGLQPAPPVVSALPPGPFSVHAEAQLAGDRLELRAFDAVGPHARLGCAGAWTGLPAMAGLFGSGPVAAGGRLALKGLLVLDDLGWIARRLKEVRRSAGRFEASFEIDGPPLSPDVHADIRLSGGELRPEAGIPPLQSLDIRARTDGRNLQIEACRGELGGAPFRMGGRIENVTDLMRSGEMALHLEGENLLLHRSESASVRADTRLALSGPVSGMRLAGTVTITDGRLAKRLGVLDTLVSPEKPRGESGLRLFSFAAPPLKDLRFSLKIGAAQPVAVRTNVARSDLTPDLELSGTGQFPVLTGVVYVDSGRLTLPAGRIEIESGLIRLLPRNPERPVLDLSGRSRIYGYDITVLIEGPYDAPEITLSSVPPLPSEDLLFMLLTGQPPKAGAARDAAEKAGMKVAVFVGRDFITRWLGEAAPESEEFILERFDVQVGRALTQAGDETIDASFRLVDGLLGKTSTLYLTGEKDAYDFYNAGIRLVFRFK